MAGGMWRQVVDAIDAEVVDGVVELAQTPAIPVAQAAIGDAIGKVETTKGDAFITRTDGSKLKAQVGLDIFQGDTVETEGTGTIGITFADSSTFSLAEAGQMTIDEMVYDAGTQEGGGAISVTTGVFTFVSGQIAKTAVDAMLINTPTATLGIRGTSVAAKIGSPKGDVFTLLEDQDAAVAPTATGDTAKGQAGDDILLTQAAGGPPPSGEITITNDVGTQTLNQPNATSSVSSRFSSPTIPVILPTAVVNRVFGAAISVARQTLSSANNSGGNEADSNDQGGGAQTSAGGGEQAAEGEGGVEAGAEAEQQTEGADGAGAPDEGADGPPTGDLSETDAAAADAFEQALATGGDPAAALSAAADAAAGSNFQATLADNPNAFGSPAAIASVVSAIVNDALGGLGSEAGDPLDAGRGNDTQIDDQQEQHQDAERLTGQLAEEAAGQAQDAAADIVEGFIDAGLIDPNAAAALLAGFEAGAGGDELFNDGGGGETGGGPLDDGFLLPPPPPDTEPEFEPEPDLPPPEPEPETGTPSVVISVDGSGGSVSFSFTANQHNLVTASSGNDVVSALGNAELGDSFDGGSGSDTLTFSDTGDQILSLTSTEYIHLAASGSNSYILTGDSGNDTWTVSNSNSSNLLDINTAAGSDTVTFQSGTHQISGMNNVESVDISGGSTNLIFTAAIDDTPSFTSVSSSTITLAGTSNTINIGASSVVGSLTGGSGTDTVGLAAGADILNVSGIENISATSSASDISLAAGGQTVAFSGTAGTITGGAGNDSLTVNSTITSLTDGGGNDTLIFGASGGTVSSIDGWETVIGGSGTDVITFHTNADNVTISGSIETLTDGGGTDTITLAASGATLGNVTGIETIIGGSGSDTVTVTDGSAASISGGAGSDALTGGTAAEQIEGGGGADTLTGGSGSDKFRYTAISESAAGGGDVITDFDAGTSTTATDKLILDGLKSGTFSFVGAHSNSFSGGGNSSARFNDTTKVLEIDTNGDGTADMDMTLTGVSLSNIDGTDFLVSGSGEVIANVSGTDSYSMTANNDLIFGSSSNDTVTLSGSANSGDTFDGGDSTDTLNLANAGNTIAVSNTESIVGGSGSDNVSLGNSGGTVTMSSVESVTGGTGDDYINLSAGSGTITVDGGAGTDKVNPANGGTWSMHLTNVEAVPGGGAGADTLTLLNAQNGLSVRLGGGGSTDTLNLANGANTITMWEDVEIINGGTGADHLTAETTLFNDITQFGGGRTRSYQLGGGEDTVTMSAGADGIAVSGVETIFGLGGNDQIALLSGGQTITHLDSVETVKGGTGTDSITLANGGQTLSDVSAVETVIGGTGADLITVSDGTATSITGGVGSDVLTGGTAGDTFVYGGAAAGSLGVDTIANFSGVTAFGGGGGETDILGLSSSDLGIASIVYEEYNWDGTTAAITLGNTAATVIVLYGNAGTQAAAAAAIAAGNSAVTNAVILFNDSANTNTLTMAHTDNAAADATESNLAVFSNNTTPANTQNLDAADFVSI